MSPQDMPTAAQARWRWAWAAAGTLTLTPAGTGPDRADRVGDAHRR